MNLKDIANQIKKTRENVILIYAFNATGKTRLSVAYKDITKEQNAGLHAGVYYNAFSEDLFVWDNDEENNGENIKLDINPSSLTDYHQYLSDENPIREKLEPYKPKYDFKLNLIKDDNPELGWESITFFLESDPEKPIKISRGEERIFVWCFFLALFEVGEWAEKQNQHFFIDDPVSSLDDHNIFITARMMIDLIENHFENRKIIITTHHMGLFSILCDWISKGETSKFKEKKTRNGKEEEINKYKIWFLEKSEDDYELKNRKKGTLLYHLLLLQILNEANENDELTTYHFGLLRQVLENISSFLGKGQFSYVLDKIGVLDTKVSDIINALSHQKVYYQKLSILNDSEKEIFCDVFEKLKITFPFAI